MLSYLNFLFKLNYKILLPFIKITYKEFYHWDDHAYNTLEKTITIPFKNLKKSRFNCIYILSLPEAWLLYYNDEDFIEYKNNLLTKINMEEFKNDKKWKIVLDFFENNDI